MRRHLCLAAGGALAAGVVAACSLAPRTTVAGLVAPDRAARAGAAAEAVSRPAAVRQAQLPAAPAHPTFSLPLPPPFDDLPGFGTFTISFAWPAEQAGYRTQAIPTSTNLVILQIFPAGAQSPLRTVPIVRPPDGGRSITIIDGLPAGDSYSIVAEAYRSTTAKAGDPDWVARGSASGFAVIPSRDVGVPITLAASSVPAVDAILPEAAVVGQTVTLKGLNLGKVGSTQPVVVFNGATASLVASRDDRTVDVRVPAGGTVGTVVVINDGIPSVSNTRYWIASRQLFIDLPPQVSPEGKVLAPGQVFYYHGKDATPGAVPAWAFAPGKALADFPGEPAIKWETSDPEAGQLAQNGLFRPGIRKGNTTLTARIGAATATTGLLSPGFPIAVVGVDSLALDRKALELVGTPDGATPAPRFAASMSATVRAVLGHSLPYPVAVRWQVDKPTALELFAIGTDSVGVRAFPRIPAGQVVLTATATDDTRFKDAATIDIKVDGSLTLEVE